MGDVDAGRMAVLFLTQVPVGGILGGIVALLTVPRLRANRSLSYPVARLAARRWPEPSDRRVAGVYVGLGGVLGVPLQLSIGAAFLFGGNWPGRYNGVVAVVLLAAAGLFVVANRIGSPPDERDRWFWLSWSVVSLTQAVCFGLVGWLLLVLSAFQVGVFRLI
jgi:hypothetical protein